jgi:hypothetical protein
MISLTTILVVSLLISMAVGVWGVVVDSYGIYDFVSVLEFIGYTIVTFAIVGGLSALLWLQVWGILYL